MSTEIVQAGNQAPAARQGSMIELTAIATDALVARKKAVDEVVERLFVEDVHYGPIPGVDGSAMLTKAGAELLAATFQLALSYDVKQTDLPFGDVRFIATCRVTHQATGTVLGEGVAEASTSETKYAWRKAGDKEWEETPEDRRRIKAGTRRDGGTWEQKQVREQAEDKVNTCLKMATKRAASDAIQAVLGVRGLILQGVTGTPSTGRQQPARQKAEPVPGDWIVVLRDTAKAKGVNDSDLVAEVKRACGTDVKKLEQITAGDYAYLSAALGKLPDADEVHTGDPADALPV